MTRHCPDDCPHLEKRRRTDFYPPSSEYYCRGDWLGFLSVRCEDCDYVEVPTQGELF